MAHLMDELTCDFCGKKAIGIQILGCCKQAVCEDHAEEILVAMKPGERKEWGICYYIRYSDDIPEEPDADR